MSSASPPTAKVPPLLPLSHFTSGLPRPGYPHTNSPYLPGPHLKTSPVKSKKHFTLLPHHSPIFSLQLFCLFVSLSAPAAPEPGSNGGHSSAVLCSAARPHLWAPPGPLPPPRASSERHKLLYGYSNV